MVDWPSNHQKKRSQSLGDQDKTITLSSEECSTNELQVTKRTPSTPIKVRRKKI
jgi:hypothetical protein